MSNPPSRSLLSQLVAESSSEPHSSKSSNLDSATTQPYTDRLLPPQTTTNASTPTFHNVSSSSYLGALNSSVASKPNDILPSLQNPSPINIDLEKRIGMDHEFLDIKPSPTSMMDDSANSTFGESRTSLATPIASQSPITPTASTTIYTNSTLTRDGIAHYNLSQVNPLSDSIPRHNQSSLFTRQMEASSSSDRSGNITRSITDTTPYLAELEDTSSTESSMFAEVSVAKPTEIQSSRARSIPFNTPTTVPLSRSPLRYQELLDNPSTLQSRDASGFIPPTSSMSSQFDHTPPHTSSSSFLTRPALHNRPSTSSMKSLSRSPSVKAAFAKSFGAGQSHNGGGSLQRSPSTNSSTMSSPMISALGDVTPLPSPLLPTDSPGPWRLLTMGNVATIPGTSSASNNTIPSRDSISFPTLPSPRYSISSDSSVSSVPSPTSPKSSHPFSPNRDHLSRRPSSSRGTIDGSSSCLPAISSTFSGYPKDRTRRARKSLSPKQHQLPSNFPSHRPSYNSDSTSTNHYLPSTSTNEERHTRNRSLSEFTPDPLTLPRRHITVSGKNLTDIPTKPTIRRETNFAEARGLGPLTSTSQVPPLTPPSSGNSSKNTTIKKNGPIQSEDGTHSDRVTCDSSIESAERAHVSQDHEKTAANVNTQPTLHDRYMRAHSEEYFEAYSRADGKKRRWHSIRSLGQGTFSRVVLCTSQPSPLLRKNDKESHYDPKTLVAIKVCEHGPRGGASTDRIEMSLKRELEMMKCVHHPSIIRLKAWNIEPTRAILVLGYSPGGDLYDVATTQRKLLKPALLRRIFAEIVGAVHYLHEMMIVHRDIKLENVLVNLQPWELANETIDWTTYRHSITTLTDLGLSRKIAPGEKLETRCGSDDYAAPEVIMGQSYDGKSTDAWSLGVLLYALLEERLPFDPAPGVSDTQKMRSRTSHRIARVEWRWYQFAGEEGDHDGSLDQFRERGLSGAMEIVEALLRRARTRWTVEKVAETEWVRNALNLPNGLSFTEEEDGEEVR